MKQTENRAMDFTSKLTPVSGKGSHVSTWKPLFPPSPQLFGPIGPPCRSWICAQRDWVRAVIFRPFIEEDYIVFIIFQSAMNQYCYKIQYKWIMPPKLFIFNCFKILFYLFLHRGEGREKERERNINVWLPLMNPQLGTWPETQAGTLTGNQTNNPLVHRPALNQLSHNSWG